MSKELVAGSLVDELLINSEFFFSIDSTSDLTVISTTLSEFVLKSIICSVIILFKASNEVVVVVLINGSIFFSSSNRIGISIFWLASCSVFILFTFPIFVFWLFNLILLFRKTEFFLKNKSFFLFTFKILFNFSNFNLRSAAFFNDLYFPITASDLGSSNFVISFSSFGLNSSDDFSVVDNNCWVVELDDSVNVSVTITGEVVDFSVVVIVVLSVVVVVEVEVVVVVGVV